MGFKDIFKKQNTEKKVEYFTDKLPDEVFATAKSLQKTSRKVVEEIEKNLIANTNDSCFENAPQSKEITNLYNKIEKSVMHRKLQPPSIFILCMCRCNISAK